MARAPRNQIEPWVLVVIALALIVAALLFYNRHPVIDSNLYSPHAPGWLAVVLFVLIGIAGRLIPLHDQRRAAKRKHDGPPTT